MSAPLLQIKDLYIEFKTARGTLKAINGISLEIRQGEIFGIVGETGCGKTVTGLSVLRLLPESAGITRGKILFDGTNLLELSDQEMRKIRGGEIAMIFQNPGTSLNPVFTIGSQLVRMVQEHVEMSTRETREYVTDMLKAVGLPDVERVMKAYPFQLSGGMQQRVMIALALACKPKLLIADEPTTALDVTIQAQILALLRNVRDEFGISIALITHNLGVVAHTCDRMAVFYAGKVVEIGPIEEVFENTRHPYTKGLMRAIPRPETRGKRMPDIPGTVLENPGAVKGCPFAPRCSLATERCFLEAPVLVQVGPDHYSACFANGDNYVR